MITIKTNNKELGVKFYHQTDASKDNCGTVCEIVELMGKEVEPVVVVKGASMLYKGDAERNIKPDQFNRAIGRKVALQRAMDASDFSKELKTQLWNEYRANCGIPR